MPESSKRPHLPSTEWLATATLQLYATELQRHPAGELFASADRMQGALADARQIWKLASEAADAEYQAEVAQRPRLDASAFRRPGPGS